LTTMQDAMSTNQEKIQAISHEIYTRDWKKNKNIKIPDFFSGFKAIYEKKV
jgi:hypothetical protein